MNRVWGSALKVRETPEYRRICVPEFVQSRVAIDKEHRSLCRQLIGTSDTNTQLTIEELDLRGWVPNPVETDGSKGSITIGN